MGSLGADHASVENHGATAEHVSIFDVARIAGVSIATVSRALRDDVVGVSAATRARVRAVAQELSYVVSPEASGLARGATGRVAVVVPGVDKWFYSTMLAGIERVLRTAGIDVLLYQAGTEEQRTRFFQELPARRKVDAVILTALPMFQAEVDRLDLMGVHVLVAGGRVLQFPYVEVDDHALAEKAVDHLVSLGHRKVAMIRTSDTDGSAWSAEIQRTAGYRHALDRHGLSTRMDYVATEMYAADAGTRAMARLLDLPDPPTAVFAYSDDLAVSAMRTLQVRGLRVPEDISIIGVDGNPTAETFGIDTVDQAVPEQARIIAEMTLSLLRGDGPVRESCVVDTRIVARGSTAAPAWDRTARRAMV